LFFFFLLGFLACLASQLAFAILVIAALAIWEAWG